MHQLGGRQFVAMTGAKNITSHQGALSFKLPQRPGNKVTYVKITLEATDTYTLEFGRIRKFNYTKVAEATDVYAQDLRARFTEHTGLHTNL